MSYYGGINGGGYGNSVVYPVEPRVYRTTCPSNAGIENVYVDGACHGNGQYGSRAGYGVWYGDNDPRNISRPLAGPIQTNQRAELTALIEGIRNSNSSNHLKVFTDSKYSQQAMTTWGDKWEINGYRNSRGDPVSNRDLVEIGRRLIKERPAPVSIEYVPGHSGILGNERADHLATAGIYKQ